MDIGAIVLDPFTLEGAPHVWTAIQQALVDPAAPQDPGKVWVAFSFVPGRLILHFDRREAPDDDLHDPSLFFASILGEFGAAGLGPGISGYLGDAAGEDVPTSTAWTCTFERRVGAWAVHEGFFYTYEGSDQSAGAFERLCTTLGLDGADARTLRRKLEEPETPFARASEDLPGELAAALRAAFPEPS